jgi:dihydrofolate synthase/folylpolyglutamate synthase
MLIAGLHGPRSALEVNYQEGVRFLFSLGNEIQTAKLGLDRIRAVLASLGDPQRAFQVVHVAGTNGKGSTCAMIEAGLRTAGRRTGLYTSPHFQQPTERIQIAGHPVSETVFAEALTAVHRTASRLPLDCHPTYFETVTAMAFWLFREQAVETAVVETGIGGRLDATNVVDPVLTVVTPVDLDHQMHLGDTVEAIAGEKAGILKPGVPAVVARQRPEAARVVETRARDLAAPLTRAEEFQPRELELHARGSSFRLFDPAPRVVCPLAGEHQVANAVTAALALRALGVSPDGIAATHWPGRLEHVAPNPDILLDGAHNPAGAAALARYLRRFYADRRRWMIFGAMSDKAVGEIGTALFPLADELVLTAPRTARAMRPQELAALAGRGSPSPDVGAALDLILAQASAEDAIIVTGSLYLVGEARALLSRPRHRLQPV